MDSMDLNLEEEMKDYNDQTNSTQEETSSDKNEDGQNKLGDDLQKPANGESGGAVDSTSSNSVQNCLDDDLWSSGGGGDDSSSLTQGEQPSEQRSSRKKRSLIDAPLVDCPDGYRRDPWGNCRPYF